MPYSYSKSPVHGYPVPDDDTPLDAVSWGKQADAIGIGSIVVCASQSEQDAYQARVAAAGEGPSVRQIIRVCRTDLDGLVMRNDGSGWRRDMGGSWRNTTNASLYTVAQPGTTLVLGEMTIDVPCAGQVVVLGDVTGIPPSSGAWRFDVWLEDGGGNAVSKVRNQENLPVYPYFTQVTAVMDVPKGTSKVVLKGRVNSLSGPVTWSSVGLTAYYN